MFALGIIIVAVFVYRIIFLRISSRNEQAILANGGQEYGVRNSQVMKYLHVLFYLTCAAEFFIRRPSFDWISMVGAGLLVFSLGMLYLVSRLLGPIWTIKLMLVNDHKFVDHWLFRNVKHPNYFLNIIPELIGLGLLCHAYFALVVIFPLYCITLYIRIKEEEWLLAEVIIPNGSSRETEMSDL